MQALKGLSAAKHRFRSTLLSDNVELERLCRNVDGKKSSLKETFLVASVERKRTTATVVCLTFATIPDVFASVKRALPSSLFLLAPSLASSFIHPSRLRSDSLLVPLSNFGLFPTVANKQAAGQTSVSNSLGET